MSPDHDSTDREQQVVSLLHAAAQRERAPEKLRAEVASMRAQAGARRRRRPTFQPVFRFVSIGTATVAAAAVALVVALGGAGAPSLAQAAAIANLRPSAPAPATDPSAPTKLLTAKVGTLHFPNWESAGGWRAVGKRVDHIGNRTATTVYYANGRKHVVYSIVSSPTLAMKGGLAQQSPPPETYTAQTYTTLSRHGRTTVVWQESGHTCLLTGSNGMSAAQLWQLAFHGFRRPLG
jgi:hypothetical protein